MVGRTLGGEGAVTELAAVVQRGAHLVARYDARVRAGLSEFPRCL
jgi:hypothetical protein